VKFVTVFTLKYGAGMVSGHAPTPVALDSCSERQSSGDRAATFRLFYGMVTIYTIQRNIDKLYFKEVNLLIIALLTMLYQVMRPKSIE
jgi:hypothetical protein